MAKDIPVEAEIYLKFWDAYRRGNVTTRDDKLIADLKRDAVDEMLEAARERNDRLKIGPNHMVEKRLKTPGLPPGRRRRT